MTTRAVRMPLIPCTPFARRARSAFDEVFDARAHASLVRRDSSADLEAPRGATQDGASPGLQQAWEQLAQELDRAGRPMGRATAAVRELVRRIVRHMAADGASRDEIRGTLTRAVRRQYRLLSQSQRELDLSASESLLADVLHCAVADERQPQD